MVQTQSKTRPGAASSEPLRLEPPAARRQGRKLPETVIGILIVAGCALAFVVWQMGGRDRVAVLALAGDMNRGELVEESDLRVVYVETDDRIAHLGENQAGSVVGRAAVTDLSAGSLVTPDQFAPVGEVVSAGDGVVGFALEAGQYPSGRLGPGDLVNVVVVATTPGVSGDTPVVSVEAAEVIDVAELATQGSRFVSVRTGENEANDLAVAAAAGGQVRLVLVGR